MAFCSFKLEDFTKKISSDKFELGREYAMILAPGVDMDSRIGWFRAFELTNKGNKIASDDATMFSNPNFGSSQAICKQSYDIVHKEKFTIVYFKFIPRNIFTKDPFTELLFESGVKNPIYACDILDEESLDITLNIITDDISTIFV